MFSVQDETRIVGLRAELAAAVEALDLSSCLPSAAARLVVEGEQLERLGHAVKMLAAARIVESDTWKGTGAKDPVEWLANQTGSSKGEAAETLETGQQLSSLPTTQAAVKKGMLSKAKAKTVAGAATANPDAEQSLLDEADAGSLGSLKNKARQVTRDADRDPEATRRRIHAKRSCRTWVDPDGVGHLHASGPSDSIARLAAKINHHAGAVFEAARKAGRREPLEAYAFDALSELVAGGVSGTPMPVGANAKVIVRIDHPALLRGHAVEGEVCEIVGIGPVPVSVVRDWMQDAFIAAVLTKGEDVTRVVHLGRRFLARQKTALQWRDPECCVEGCTNTYRLEYDHDTGWAETHTTEVDDGDRLCHADHKKKTAGWYLAAADANGKRRLIPPGHDEHPFQVAARRARGRAEPPAAQAS